MRKITARFRGRTEGGHVVGIVETRAEVDMSNLSGRASALGMPAYQLEDGRLLNRLDAETFEIVQGGERVRLVKD